MSEPGLAFCSGSGRRPIQCPSRIRQVGGWNGIQALASNVGTFPLMGRQNLHRREPVNWFPGVDEQQVRTIRVPGANACAWRCRVEAVVRPKASAPLRGCPQNHTVDTPAGKALSDEDDGELLDRSEPSLLLERAARIVVLVATARPDVCPHAREISKAISEV